ncbi:MAG: DUF1801 domain-containing protein [Rubrivivax sp.]|nr:DUF1801 domain-containing protein [Rubrivivax sp.]
MPRTETIATAAGRLDAPPAVVKGIDDYIAMQASAVQPIVQRLQAILHEEAPLAQEGISYRMPAFRQGGVLIYFSAFKHHIGVYPPVRGDAALLAALAPYLGKKGNLAFPLAGAMPYDLIRRVVRQRLKEHAAHAPRRGAP